MTIRHCLAVALLFLAWPVLARQVELPLTFDFALLRQTLLAQLFTDANGTARVWQGDHGCSELELRDPQVDGQGGRLRILSIARTHFGTAVGGRCTRWFDWQGLLEVFHEPSVSASQRQIAFRVVESNLYATDGHREATATKLWNRIKQRVHPRLAQVRIDLNRPLQALEETLPLLLPQQVSGQAARLMASAIPVAVEIRDSGLELNLMLTLPERPPSSVPDFPEPVLTAQEFARWETAWRNWDAFLTHVIKQAARDTTLPSLRFALLEVLIEARYQLVAVLTKPANARQPDPVRALFLRTWERLGPVLGQLGAALPAEVALRYLSFIAAADALRALDTLGPEVGLEISSDGLRRLARILGPSSNTDPLAYRLAVDVQLRRLLGFGVPLNRRAAPAINLRDWLIPAAQAAPTDPAQLVTRLDRWVPTKAEIATYLPLVRTLLEQAAEDILHSSKLPDRYHSLYRKLVLATAWQESCWRHYIRKNGRVAVLRSGAGSVGIMQINVRVWRGFYDPQAVKTDIAYNATAGAEILSHYLVDYAIKKGEHTKRGRIDDLARATYAVYHGGPSHLQRYRQAKTSQALQAIDRAFWTKYQRVAEGDELAVASCYGLTAPLQRAARQGKGDAEQPPLVPGKAVSLEVGAGRLAPQPSAGARWLLAQDPRHFTLQVIAAQDEQAVRDYLADHALADRARYFAFHRQGQTWFAAVYGVYATRTEAEQAAKSLVERTRESPWIRPLADVHEAIRGGEGG